MRFLKIVLALTAVLVAVKSAAAADIKNIDLGKGAQVWFVEDHTVPIVSFSISLPAGAGYDPAAKPGVASFAASMLDEGAGNLDSAAFHQALAAKAIQFQAQADRDFTVITVTTLSENAGEALRLLQMALTHPRFDAEPLARVRTEMVQSLQQEEAEPQRVAAKTFSRLFFNGHPYGRAVDGDVSGLGAITANDLRAFARGHWVKNGIRIAVAGDIAQPVLTRLLGQTFAPLPGTAVAPLPNVGRLGSPGVHVVQMAVPQPSAVFGLPGIMRADPDYIPGYVANYILGGGGFSSRLTEEIRVKRGLTYGISTSLGAYQKASVWQGSVATRADAINQTVQLVRQVMTNFADKGPTQQELDDAKTFLTGSFPMAFASNSGIASQLGAFQRQGLDIGYVARRNGLIQAVTLADVQRVSKRLFHPDRLTVVVAGTPQGGPAAQTPKPAVLPKPAPMPGAVPPAAAPQTAMKKSPGPALPAKAVDKPAIKTPAKP